MNFRKGTDRYIYIVAMMVLAVLFILLWVTAVENWLTGLGENLTREVLGYEAGSGGD